VLGRRRTLDPLPTGGEVTVTLDVETATVLVGRLNAHWPRIGENEVSSRDWIRTLRLIGPTASEVVELIVTTWTESRVPTIGDVQAVARQVARRRVLERPREIEGPRPSGEVVAEGLAAMRRALEQAAGKGNR
jgi:hypothetical protein